MNNTSEVQSLEVHQMNVFHLAILFHALLRTHGLSQARAKSAPDVHSELHFHKALLTFHSCGLHITVSVRHPTPLVQRKPIDGQ